jgi:hypothetical protein
MQSSFTRECASRCTARSVPAKLPDRLTSLPQRICPKKAGSCVRVAVHARIRRDASRLSARNGASHRNGTASFAIPSGKCTATSVLVPSITTAYFHVSSSECELGTRSQASTAS